MYLFTSFFKANLTSHLLIIALSVFLASCSGSKPADGGNTPRGDGGGAAPKKNDPISVSLATAESRQVPVFIQATGSLTAAETSNVSPKVSGKVTSVFTDVGDFVRKDQIIAKLDDTDARIRLRQLEAGVRQADAAVRQAEARLGLNPNGTFNSSTVPEVRVAKSNYDQTLAELRQAEANEKRYRELVESGDVAMITYEGFRTARDTARIRSNSAKENLDAAVNSARQNNQAIKSAQASADAARTQLATAQQSISDSIIRAPFAGFVSDRPTAVGEFVTSSTTIATILRTNPIKIQIRITESDVPSVSVGQGVSIEVDAYKDRKFAGTVSGINPALDAESRSAIVEAQIENSGNLLRSGMFATVRVTRQGGSEGVFVPKSAVYNDQNTQNFRVFVIQEGVAKLRTVQIGTEENDKIQIVTGVNAGENVATSNLAALFEGAAVQAQ